MTRAYWWLFSILTATYITVSVMLTLASWLAYGEPGTTLCAGALLLLFVVAASGLTAGFCWDTYANRRFREIRAWGNLD